MNKLKLFLTIILFGSMWGLAEATLGYLLHLMPHGFSGMFMFPIGFYFMYRCFKSTGRVGSIFMVALIASSIKLIDLFLPIRSPMSVINPAVSIVLEASVVFVAFKVFKEKQNYISAFSMSFAWIMIFPLVQFAFRPEIGLYKAEIATLIGRVALNTLVSGFLIGTFLKFRDFKILKNIRFNTEKISFVQPALVLVFALFFEVLNTLI